MKKLLLILLCFPLIGFGQTTVAQEGGSGQKCNSGNCENGYGIYIFSEGSRYVGEYKYGKKNGLGTYTWTNGSKYVGEWKDGKINGHGTKTWDSDEGYYVGEWKDGKWHGEAIYQGVVDGFDFAFSFVGVCWSGNFWVGHGTYLLSDGTIVRGIWKEGKFIRE